MNYQEIINTATKEIMHLLKTGNKPAAAPVTKASLSFNVSGKTIVLLLPNLDVDMKPFLNLLEELRKKNLVRAYLPKWGRMFYADSGLGAAGIETSFLDYANANNGKTIFGDIYIVPVNNDNFLRKTGSLNKSSADTAAIVQALARGAKVYFVTDKDYKATPNVVENVTKTGVKVGTIEELNAFLASGSAPKPSGLLNITPSAVAPSPAARGSEDNCFTCTTHSCITKCLSKVEHIFNNGADRVGATLGNEQIPINIASFIDHTLLKPDAPEADIIKLCEEANKYKFASVCVNPSYVPLSAKLLKGSGVMVCTVIGFPLGATTTETKAFETKQAIANGADEIDMVINVGALKSKDYAKVEEDIREVVKACNGTTLKVILETALLTKEEKIKACELSKKAGATFVKTSTGFGPGGATEEDIALMREVVGPEMGVKASGGVRDQMGTLKMLKAGATRIGASASIAIVTNKAPEKKSGY